MKVAGWVLLGVAVLGGVVWLVWHDVVGYRDNCLAARGHIENVRDTDICLDPSGRIIYVDSWGDQVVKPRSDQ